MAFCTGYLSSVSLSCSFTKFAKFQKTSKQYRIASCVFAADKTRERSTAGDVGSTPTPSKLHPALCPNAHNTSFKGAFQKEYEQKIQEVRHLLQLSGEDDPIQRLLLVDTIQRLRVNHHFEEEIEAILREHYVVNSAYNNRCEFNTLHDLSLFFRLMRQHGHYISADVFNKFKGEDGRFKEELKGDIRGLMELYEAAQLSFEGEYTLDEAENFSRQNLNKYCLEDTEWCGIVTKQLRHPYHKSIASFTSNFLKDTNLGTKELEKSLQELAMMDLQTRKSEYKKELFQVSEWWKELRLAENLSLARNQPLKWYTWSMAIDDISLSEQRIELAKSIAFIYLIDDIFDLYGTPDELIIFVEAVNKWDYAAPDTLPGYMKMCYKALLDTTNEIGYTIYEKHGYNPIDYLKKSWASLCNAFLVEAKWFASGNLPNANEYLENGKVSSGVYMVMVHLFFLLGHGGTYRDCSIHLKDISELMSSAATILRLWDDLGSAKDEDQDGEDGSYIKCYMNEHISLSAAQAQEHVMDLIAVEWKHLNKECFNLNHISASSLKKATLNIVRMIPLMYSYDDNQRLPILEEYVKFMLFD